jgi:dolichol kinase
MRLILTVFAVFVVLVLNEVLWRRRHAHGELSRKFVHVVVGCFVAFWPFFLTWHQIELLSLAFLIVVSLSKILRIFRAIHSVQRPTWGEVCFALSVGIVAIATHDKWIYMASLLQMGLADGLAAVIGVQFGRRNSYVFLGHSKSLAGTLTFFLTSVVILSAYSHYSGDHLSALVMTALALAASILENASVQGIDNLAVPLMTALLLSLH